MHPAHPLPVARVVLQERFEIRIRRRGGRAAVAPSFGTLERFQRDVITVIDQAAAGKAEADAVGGAR